MTKMTKSKMARKGLVPPSPEDGEPMTVVKTEETWSECILEDGAKIRIKPVIMDVRKLKNPAASGNTQYGIKTTMIIDVQSAAKQGKKKG